VRIFDVFLDVEQQLILAGNETCHSILKTQTATALEAARHPSSF
jgi:hypothetical protein